MKSMDYRDQKWSWTTTEDHYVQFTRRQSITFKAEKCISTRSSSPRNRFAVTLSHSSVPPPHRLLRNHNQSTSPVSPTTNSTYEPSTLSSRASFRPLVPSPHVSIPPQLSLNADHTYSFTQATTYKTLTIYNNGKLISGIL